MTKPAMRESTLESIALCSLHESNGKEGFRPVLPLLYSSGEGIIGGGRGNNLFFSSLSSFF
jgi:hypothetical protein